MRLTLFGGLRPFTRGGTIRNAFAGITLASMNVPQVLGHTRIAGTPAVTGLYTVLLPRVGFTDFGSSGHLVVAADSATAAIFSSSLAHTAQLGSAKYMAWRLTHPWHYSPPRPNPTRMDAIRVTHLTKRYGDVLAVDDIDFATPAGATVGLRLREGESFLLVKRSNLLREMAPTHAGDCFAAMRLACVDGPSDARAKMRESDGRFDCGHVSGLLARHGGRWPRWVPRSSPKQ